MPYTAPLTVSAGQIYTPTMYNTYLQGNADAGFMRMLADTTLGSAAASIDFASIPATFAHLLLVGVARSDTAATSTGFGLRFNNDTAGNYFYQDLTAGGTGVTGADALLQTLLRLGLIPAASAPDGGFFGGFAIFIPAYLDVTGSAAKRQAIALRHYMVGSSTGNLPVSLSAGWWNSVAAINRITLLASAGNLVAGTRATLYGLPQ